MRAVCLHAISGDDYEAVVRSTSQRTVRRNDCILWVPFVLKRMPHRFGSRLKNAISARRPLTQGTARTNGVAWAGAARGESTVPGRLWIPIQSGRRWSGSRRRSHDAQQVLLSDDRNVRPKSVGRTLFPASTATMQSPPSAGPCDVRRYYPPARQRSARSVFEQCGKPNCFGGVFWSFESSAGTTARRQFAVSAPREWPNPSF